MKTKLATILAVVMFVAVANVHTSANAAKDLPPAQGSKLTPLPPPGNPNGAYDHGRNTRTYPEQEGVATPKLARTPQLPDWQRGMAQPAKKRVLKSGPSAVWGVGPDTPFGRVYLWNGASWSEPNPAARLGQVYGCKHNPSVAWGIGTNQRIFRTFDGGVTWVEPNPAAKANQITGCGYWAIGNSYRVFRSDDQGLSWYEPNPPIEVEAD